MEYKDLLKDGRWQKRRLEIMQRDGFNCRDCGTTGFLNIHHLQYNGKPWEAEDSQLITLCEKCHEKRHDPKTNYHEELRKAWMQYYKAKRRIKKEKHLITRLQWGGLKFAKSVFEDKIKELTAIING